MLASRQSAPGGLPRRGFIICRIEHHTAIASFAVALSAQICFVAQCKMHHPPLPRRHGGKLERRARLPDFLGGYACGHSQLLQTQRALVLAIKSKLLMLARR